MTASAPVVVADSIFFKLVRVVNLTARPFVESIGKAHRLTLNEWRVMLVLAAHPGVAASSRSQARPPIGKNSAAATSTRPASRNARGSVRP